MLPKDIQQARVEIEGHNGAQNGYATHDLRPIGNPRPIAGVLRYANGPVTIIAGEQVARDDARTELEELRALLRARVATVPDAKDDSGDTGFGVVVGARCHRCHGSPRCGRGGGRQRRVPGGGHPTVGHRAHRPRRSACGGADRLDRLGAPVHSVHPRAHRRSAWLADAC